MASSPYPSETKAAEPTPGEVIVMVRSSGLLLMKVADSQEEMGKGLQEMWSVEMVLEGRRIQIEEEQTEEVMYNPSKTSLVCTIASGTCDRRNGGMREENAGKVNPFDHATPIAFLKAMAKSAARDIQLSQASKPAWKKLTCIFTFDGFFVAVL